ncbi:hypothetical protein [uncultured Proteiniphilum sp.]|uniref:hypothetical protein n=1 Tax=uncultured Proteiniphilum sp. TaxID=497637 RepID=UPI00260D60F2|nr:hypothetical protein [uncultured Proteiniphilum sp.]
MKVAEEEILDIFRLLSIPMDEQDILVQTINKENTCWDNLKGILYKLVRNKND